ncbi:MAG: heat-inducible transcription repressor HrcA [Clostridiales bacterium]|nr:heat-inducible transcription repressor HrcA [Clostridiales bacterium]
MFDNAHNMIYTSASSLKKRVLNSKERELENFNLSKRREEILFKSVEDYIKLASPITSMSIHTRHLSNISTATLRNELNTLEAMGYLKQLHTSSGRIPTSKAYRVYVDSIMKENKFNKKDLTLIKNLFNKRSNLLSEIVSNIANTVSEVTNYPTVVLLNGFNNLIIKNIKIIPLIDRSLLLLISTSTGIINNNIKITQDISEQNCMDASNFLTNRFSGKTISVMITDMKELVNSFNSEIKEYESIFNVLINGLIDLTEKSSKEFSVKGATKLLQNPEYNNIENAKKVLDVLEDNNKLETIFDTDSMGEITFSIGNENANEDLSNCSVIKANYSVDGENIAQIGVIGPERMDYAKIAGALKYIVDEMKNLTKLDKGE